MLNKPCQSCDKPMNGGVYRKPKICPHCFYEQKTEAELRATQTQSAKPSAPEKTIKVKTSKPVKVKQKPVANIAALKGLGEFATAEEAIAARRAAMAKARAAAKTQRI